MLQSLHIRNFALIDKLDIQFDEGFSVITGETGAGKSILLGAISMLLGQRADLKMIKAGEQRCIIEAEFNLSNYDFAQYFSEHDIDFDDSECIIRRELTSAGKSRTFINDTPISLSELKELGDQLIDIHSQHQNLLLSKQDFQLQVLDSLAADSVLLTDYKAQYDQWRQLTQALEQARAQAEKDSEERDYLSYQLEQLTEAKLIEGEEEELEQEQNTLSHAEEIKSALYESNEMMDGENGGIINEIRNLQRRITSIAHVYPRVEELAERIDSSYIEMRDIASDIESMVDDVEYDPQRLAFVDERLATLHNLKQRFHVDNVEQLIEEQHSLEQRLALIDNSDEQLSAMEKQIVALEKGLDKFAKQLTSERTKAAKNVEKQMAERLAPLGMPNVQFQVKITQEENFTSTGRDHVTFLFSANKNMPMQPLSQVASGGEMARLMLVLKAIVSGAVKLPTIIFDEIDTGVSGHIAEKMAQIMKEMGTDNHRQVISITHLPQIAAMGQQHYRVYKTDDADTTTSHIVRLNNEERITELAHMLSGSTLTTAAIENAKALLDNIQ